MREPLYCQMERVLKAPPVGGCRHEEPLAGDAEQLNVNGRSRRDNVLVPLYVVQTRHRPLFCNTKELQCRHSIPAFPGKIWFFSKNVWVA